MSTLRQGDIVYFEHGGKSRPGVILSNNHLCRVANELLVAPLSSSEKVLSGQNSNYHVPFRYKGTDSVIKVDNISIKPITDLTQAGDWLNAMLLKRTLSAYQQLVLDLPI